MTYIDLTHTLVEDMPVYPGDPKPEISQYALLNIEGYNDFRINTTMHVGTHVDAPLHFLEGGKKIASFPIDHFIGPGVVLDARGKDKVDVELLEGININQGDIVLICTGMDHNYRTTDYYENYLSLTEAVANRLVELGVKMIGIDGPSPDREPFPVHKILLSKDILIAENLTNLDQLFGIPKFEVQVIPVKWDTEAAPARVFAHHE
jgi:kynurenine formamidase